MDEALRAFYDESVRAACAEGEIDERLVRDWIGTQLITENGLRAQVRRGLDVQPAMMHLLDVFLVRAVVRHGTAWFELAHDRLIRPIRASNKDWRRKNLPPLQRFSVLWSKERGNQSLLLRGKELRDAEVWAHANADLVTKIDLEYLTACREARAAWRRKRSLFRWGGVAAALVVGCIGGAVALYKDWELQQLHTLHHHRLVLDSQLQLEQDAHTVAALLAREAYLERERLVAAKGGERQASR